MKAITVVSLDDHHVVRHGIQKLLENETNIKLVGEGWAGEQLEPLLDKHKPDILLLDIGMPQSADETTDDAFRVLPAVVRIRRRFPGVQVIIISQHASNVLIKGALELDVRGYLLKGDMLSRHLVEAIKAVHRGETYFSEGIRQYLHKSGSRSRAETLLSPRQQQVVEAIMANPGWTYAQHARMMDVSDSTFDYHLRQVFARLEVNCLAEMVVAAIRCGIVRLDDPVESRSPAEEAIVP